MKRIFSFVLLLSFLLSACGANQATPTVVAQPTKSANLGPAIYTDPSQPTEARVEDLLKRMTLDEKIGQMTQVQKSVIENKPDDITKYYIGSILSVGGGKPPENSPPGWDGLVNKSNAPALATQFNIHDI